MEYEIYTVYDRVSGMYGGLVLHVNKASAIRWFGDIMSKNEHAADMDLYYIGTFDTQDGVASIGSPVFVTNVATMEAVMSMESVMSESED
jgi:hypothetical protein